MLWFSQLFNFLILGWQVTQGKQDDKVVSKHFLTFPNFATTTRATTTTTTTTTAKPKETVPTKQPVTTTTTALPTKTTKRTLYMQQRYDAYRNKTLHRQALIQQSNITKSKSTAAKAKQTSAHAFPTQQGKNTTNPGAAHTTPLTRFNETMRTLLPPPSQATRSSTTPRTVLNTTKAQTKKTAMRINMPHPTFLNHYSTTTAKPTAKPTTTKPSTAKPPATTKRSRAQLKVNETVYPFIPLQPRTSTMPTTVAPTQPTTTKLALTTNKAKATTKQTKYIQPDSEEFSKECITDKKEIFHSLPSKFTCYSVCNKQHILITHAACKSFNAIFFHSTFLFPGQ